MPDPLLGHPESLQRRLIDDKVALLLGSEGHGLSHRWLQAADVRPAITISAAVDSLNVSAASAVACFSVNNKLRDSDIA